MDNYKKKVSKVLNDYLIPDLANIVTSYLSCQKCKIYYQGFIRCICDNYMCKCQPREKCADCNKIICKRCKNTNFCCRKSDLACSFCNRCYWGNNDIEEYNCLFENCLTTSCNKCFDRFGGLCRGHYLLRKYNKNHPKLSGIEGS